LVSGNYVPALLYGVVCVIVDFTVLVELQIVTDGQTNGYTVTRHMVLAQCRVVETLKRHLPRDRLPLVPWESGKTISGRLHVSWAEGKTTSMWNTIFSALYFRDFLRHKIGAF